MIYADGTPASATTIKEIRVNECWYEDRYEAFWGGDLALLILDYDKTDANLGEDFIEIWDEAVDGLISVG